MYRLLLVFALGCSSKAASVPVNKVPPDPTQPAGDAACKVDADCGWGEIEKDITKPSDCPCLLGCPGLAQSKATIERRFDQYKKICKPGIGGDGQPCPIDDCARPPELHCVSGKCGR